jgi:NADPH-dependent curcumin reductase CurA
MRTESLCDPTRSDYGYASAPQAFLGLFSGNNVGKMLVDLRDDVPFATG